MMRLRLTIFWIKKYAQTEINFSMYMPGACTKALFQATCGSVRGCAAPLFKPAGCLARRRSLACARSSCQACTTVSRKERLRTSLALSFCSCASARVIVYAAPRIASIIFCNRDEMALMNGEEWGGTGGDK